MAGTIYGTDNDGNKLNPNDFGGACNLGSLFLHKFVENPFAVSAQINYDKLKKVIFVAVRMLDNIIDINNFPDKIYENYQKSFRTIGLGITGLADMFAMLGVKYNSAEAKNIADSLMNFIALNTYKASIELSKEKGEFPLLNRQKYVESGFITKHCERYSEWLEVKNDIMKYGIRNSKMLSVAPTGTLSLTFGNNCSSGLEPIFSLEYERKVKVGGQAEDNIQIIPMRDYAYEEWLKVKDSDECIIDKNVFITALEMTVDEHVDILGAIAYHVDMSCSKTINVPADYSFEDTKKIYEKCHELGIKGCTIFRPNEIRKGIMITEDSKTTEGIKTTDNAERVVKYDSISPVSRKTIGTTHGNTYCKKTACGTSYITINKDKDGNVVECFVNTSKGGICKSNIDGLNRMISLCLRSGVRIDEITDQLIGITCQACVKMKTKGETLDGLSCPDTISRTLREFVLGDNNFDAKTKQSKNDQIVKETSSPKCPECGAKLRLEGGCSICVGDEEHVGCGWSKCN